jgi:hypothetical protein
MRHTPLSRFEPFAVEFVRAYWQTVKDGDFSMPPNEPVEESLDELLSTISHETQLEPLSSHRQLIYKLRMTQTLGSWWLFSFREKARTWELVASTAKSDDDENPHDLLGPVYSRWFESFLRHVTEVANVQTVN